MSVLLVAYDLNQPGQKHKKLLEILHPYKPVKLSESSYAILTNKSPQNIYKVLQPVLDSTDKLFVITLYSPFAGDKSNEETHWLDANLGGLPGGVTWNI